MENSDSNKQGKVDRPGHRWIKRLFLVAACVCALLVVVRGVIVAPDPFGDAPEPAISFVLPDGEKMGV